MSEKLIHEYKGDEHFESSLRPQFFEDFVGQKELKERLTVFLEAALQRNEVPGHCLFSGPPGLGKTSLAYIISKKLQCSCVSALGPQFDKPVDLLGVLTNLKRGDVLFIDEIHRLSKTAEEYLYSAMEDYKVNLMIDSGPGARTVKVDLEKFTLVGATTKLGLVSLPLRSRFMFTEKFVYYSEKDLFHLLLRSSKLLGLEGDEEALNEVASRSRGTPRIANQLLRWVRDYVQIKGQGVLNRDIARKALNMLSIDEWGLNETDKKILLTIVENYQGGPVGLNTLAIAIGEEPQTIEEVYEPFLILKGLLKRTSRGRMVTELAYKRLQLGINFSKKSNLEIK